VVVGLKGGDDEGDTSQDEFVVLLLLLPLVFPARAALMLPPKLSAVLRSEFDRLERRLGEFKGDCGGEVMLMAVSWRHSSDRSPLCFLPIDRALGWRFGSLFDFFTRRRRIVPVPPPPPLLVPPRRGPLIGAAMSEDGTGSGGGVAWA